MSSYFKFLPSFSPPRSPLCWLHLRGYLASQEVRRQRSAYCRAQNNKGNDAHNALLRRVLLVEERHNSPVVMLPRVRQGLAVSASWGERRWEIRPPVLSLIFPHSGYLAATFCWINLESSARGPFLDADAIGCSAEKMFPTLYTFV